MFCFNGCKGLLLLNYEEQLPAALLLGETPGPECLRAPVRVDVLVLDNWFCDLIGLVSTFTPD